MAACGRAAEGNIGEISTVSRGNPNEVQLPTKKSTQTLEPTASRKGFHLSSDEDRSFSVEFDEFILQTWMDMVAESFQTGSTKSPC